MGVGGLKGHGTHISSGSGRAGRPYWWILLLFVALGALIFGVMALHKHRERRIFDLVIKDKDLQLHSLHLHLQKERDFAKEAKQKSEELKSELNTLRNQKLKLSGKILELQSTISFLKEEHKAIESALEEKQNEIDLMKERDETVSTSKENGGQRQNYPITADGENLINGEDEREAENVAVSRNISGEQPKILKSSQQGFHHKNKTDENHSEQMSCKISKENGSSDIDTQKSNTNGTEARINSVVDFEKPKDVDDAMLAANTKFGNNGQQKNVAGITRGKRFFRNEKDAKQKERPASDENAKFKLFNPALRKEGKESKGDTKVGSESKTKKAHSSGVLKSNMNSKNRISERFSQSADEVQVNKNINDKGSRVTSDDRKNKPKGIVHPEAQTNGNPHRTERSGNDKAANPKKRNSADKTADVADWEVDDIHESDSHKLAVQL